ncbi:mRNA splicing factor SYF2 [Suillus occidentalis]|nr:mRNA splicing factor SYF2 [Suillus occidentalis]
MCSSTKANRASLIEESARATMTMRDAARPERQRKLAEDRGEDVERQKNWEWTIEENDNWARNKAWKARRADYEFHDDAHAARRRYKKDLDLIKPDLAAYIRQKEVVLGLAPGSLAKSGSGSSALTAFDPSGGQVVQSAEQRMAAESFCRDANTLLYADNKPTEDAIDRVVGKINRDIDKKGKFSRKRFNEDEGDIAHIDERNRVFNKKIARYYDKSTSEIRASFERGTAL